MVISGDAIETLERRWLSVQIREIGHVRTVHGWLGGHIFWLRLWLIRHDGELHATRVESHPRRNPLRVTVLHCCLAECVARSADRSPQAGRESVPRNLFCPLASRHWSHELHFPATTRPSPSTCSPCRPPRLKLPLPDREPLTRSAAERCGRASLAALASLAGFLPSQNPLPDTRAPGPPPAHRTTRSHSRPSLPLRARQRVPRSQCQPHGFGCACATSKQAPEVLLQAKRRSSPRCLRQQILCCFVHAAVSGPQQRIGGGGPPCAVDSPFHDSDQVAHQDQPFGAVLWPFIARCCPTSIVREGLDICYPLHAQHQSGDIASSASCNERHGGGWRGAGGHGVVRPTATEYERPFPRNDERRA